MALRESNSCTGLVDVDDEYGCTPAPHDDNSDPAGVDGVPCDAPASSGCASEAALSAARRALAMRETADADLLCAAVAFAIANPPRLGDDDDVDAGDAFACPGAWSLTGEGRQPVSEVVAVRFGARLGMHEQTAMNLMRDAIDLVCRFPSVWEQVVAGMIPARTARRVASASRALKASGAAMVDTAIAARCESTRDKDLKALVIECQATSEPDREPEDPSAGWSVWDQGTREDGTATVQISADLPDVTAFTTTLHTMANHLGELGDNRSAGARLSTALGLLSRPVQAAQVLSHNANSVHTAGGSADSPGVQSGYIGTLLTGGQVLSEPAVGDVELHGGVPRGWSAPVVPVAPSIHLTMHVDVHQDDAESGPCESVSPVEVTTERGTHLGVVAVDVAQRWIARAAGIIDTQTGAASRSVITGPAPLHLQAGSPAQHWDSVTQQVARVPGAGIVLQPVIDTAAAASNSYTPSESLRRIVMLRDRTCVFPNCAVPAGRCDLDHIEPFDPTRPAVDQTTTDNLACLCRRHHRALAYSVDLAHDGWTYRRHLNGYEWTAPLDLPLGKLTVGGPDQRAETCSATTLSTHTPVRRSRARHHPTPDVATVHQSYPAIPAESPYTGRSALTECDGFIVENDSRSTEPTCGSALVTAHGAVQHAGAASHEPIAPDHNAAETGAPEPSAEPPLQPLPAVVSPFRGGVDSFADRATVFVRRGASARRRLVAHLRSTTPRPTSRRPSVWSADPYARQRAEHDSVDVPWAAQFCDNPPF